MSDEQILIVSPSWVGDMVMSQTLYSLIKSRSPDTSIDVIAPAASKPLLSRMPEVRASVLFDVGHGEIRIGYRRGFARALKPKHYDRAIVLPNSLKSALVPFFADVPVRTGYLGEYRYLLLNDIRHLNRKRLPRMIDRFMYLGQREDEMTLPAFEPPALLIDRNNQQECCDRFGLARDVSIVGLCPGAEFGDAKRWPEEHFADLAERALSRGQHVWLFGSPGDKAVTGRIREALPRELREGCHDLAGRTTLLDAIDLLNCCHQVVCNDSGLMHIAAAVGCRTVVLYGSTSPEFTPPLTESATIIKKDLSCSPCFKRDCPLKHKKCLTELTPEQVAETLWETAV